jgi:tetratricopeptide (TPR) repeat protein
VQGEKNSEAAAALALGRSYRMQGALSGELLLWEQRVQLDPRDADATERLGWLLWFTGRADEALPWLHAALAERPDGRWARFYLGNASLALGEFDEAERAYAAALAVHPDHSSAQAGLIWSHLAAGRVDEARRHLRTFQEGSFDGDRVPLKRADLEYFLREDELAERDATESLDEPDARYWPRGILASTILGALGWEVDRSGAEAHLEQSRRIDHERLAGGDEGYMPHIDLAAVEATCGDSRAACDALRSAIAAGWRYRALATRDRLFENVRTDEEFRALVSASS